MKKTIGFIGMGNMAQAIAQGFIASGHILSDQLYAYAPNQDKLKNNAARIGFIPCASAMDVAAASDIIVMACKPYQIETVLADIAPLLPGKTLLSVALGWDYAKYQQHLLPGTRVQFIMPNTPAQIGQGVIQVCTLGASQDEMEEFVRLLAPAGLVDQIPEGLIDAASALSGCGPAFTYLFIEGLADGAVACGLPRAQALAYAAQMVAGSANLVLESGKHPGALKDAVCSPGGTTIQGVRALEERGFRSAAMNAVIAAYEKTLSLSK